MLVTPGSQNTTSGRTTLSHSPEKSVTRTLNEFYKELFTIQISVLDLILFYNFLLKSANKSPSRIKPERILWCPEFKRLLWSPTQLNSCIAVHLKETRNSPDLFVCFSFGQSSNRWTLMTPAVSSLHSAKTPKPRGATGVRGSSSQPSSPAGLRGRAPALRAERERPGRGPATGYSDWLWQLSSSFASSWWWVSKWWLTPVLPKLAHS
jgi:hypothetical protein